MINVKEKNRNNLILVFQAFVIFCIGIIHYSSFISLKIGNASPLIIIPFLIVVCFFSGMWRGVIFAFIYGIYMDSIAADTLCFNTLVLGITMCVCGLLITHVLNRNISAVLLLSLLTCVFYFLLKWLIFYLFAGVEHNQEYLFYYAVPSAIYTAAFSLPFYYVAKFFSNSK
jgi:rod shape-determining protein MreD